MSGLELNKIAAAVLVAGLVAMIAGIISEALYETEGAPEKRGYKVEVADSITSASTEASPQEEALNIPELLASANMDEGKKIAKKCMACHSFEKDGPNKVGPNLWEVLGQRFAHKDDFTYSDALKNMSGNWDYESMFQFINNPRKFIKGTKMAFAGIKNPQQIADLVSFIRSNSDNPLPLPENTSQNNEANGKNEIEESKDQQVASDSATPLKKEPAQKAENKKQINKSSDKKSDIEEITSENVAAEEIPAELPADPENAKLLSVPEDNQKTGPEITVTESLSSPEKSSRSGGGIIWPVSILSGQDKEESQ